MSKKFKIGAVLASVFLFVSAAYAYSFNLLPNVANTYTVGSASLYWSDLFGGDVHIKTAANGKVGTFIANGASAVTVSNTSITANSIILYGLKTVGGTVGAIPVTKTITAGTGFTVAGAASDTSTYYYVVIESF